MDFSLKQLSSADMLPTIRQTLAEGKNVRFTPRGISMLPMLHPGRDTVVLSPLPETLRKYDVVLYLRSDGQLVLHRIIRVGQTYTCMGDNQFDKEPGLSREQMMGVVTEFVRKGKTVRVTAFSYRVYCRLLHYTRLPRRCFRRIGRCFAGGKKA